MKHTELGLRKFVAPEFVFGTDARLLAGRYAINLGARRPLVVSDPGVMAAGWTGDVIDALTKESLEYSLFTGVTSNPKAEEVEEGARIFRRDRCDILIAVGGGSPMDCAKGIGIIAATDRSITEFEGVDKIPAAIPPLICVPTTAGSSADVSQFAIITDTTQKRKLAIVSKMIVPDAALIDHVTTTTMSPELTAGSGLDGLCHAVESVVSTAHSPITDLHALQAASLVCSNLPVVMDSPDNLTFRGRMMLASLSAGLAFSNASLGLTHAMAHAVGGLLDSPHGECNALLLPWVIEFNFSSAPDRYRLIGEAMGLRMDGMSDEDVKATLISKVRNVGSAAGITQTMADLGISRTDIPHLVQRAMVDPCVFTNPRRPRRRDIEAIYEKAL